MRIMRLLFILGLLLTSINAFAADGDLIVNGKIGVGTTSPSTPLEVNGIIKSTTGGVQFPDSTTQTTALPASCTSGQVAKWNGTQWACAADDSGASGTTSVYTIANSYCLANNPLTTSSTCLTRVCGQDGDGISIWSIYYTCAGSCSSATSAQSCSNTYVGKLVP